MWWGGLCLRFPFPLITFITKRSPHHHHNDASPNQVMYDLALAELAPALSIVGITKAALEQKKATLFPLEGFRCAFCVRPLPRADWPLDMDTPHVHPHPQTPHTPSLHRAD